MGKVRRVLRCHSCGAILQSSDKNLPGYISKSVLEGTIPKIPYCNVCYEKMIQLNASVLDDEVDNAIVKILDDAVATDAFIIWVVDLFSFTGNLNKDITKKIRNNRVTVVGTKRDLFDSKIKDDTFVRFITERFEEFGITPQSVIIIGENSTLEPSAMIKNMNNCRKGHDVYMIGSSSSGKTTLINKCLKAFENKSRWTIRSEIYPGTDVKVLEIPLTNSAFFYELPALSLSTSTVSKVEKDILKYIIPHDEVSIYHKSLSVGETILVGNLAMFEIITGKSINFKFYSAESVEYKKISSRKVDRVIDEMNKKKNIRPYSERFTSFTDFDVFEYEMENDGKVHDIAIEGLVTASFVAQGQTIRVGLPKGVALKEALAKVR